VKTFHLKNAKQCKFCVCVQSNWSGKDWIIFTISVCLKFKWIVDMKIAYICIENKRYILHILWQLVFVKALWLSVLLSLVSYTTWINGRSLTSSTFYETDNCYTTTIVPRLNNLCVLSPISSNDIYNTWEGIHWFG
jgi:hypothetical protein